MALTLRALGAGLVASSLLACGSLDSPTRPEPTPDPRPAAAVTPTPGPTPTPVLSGPAPKPSPTPEPGATPDPTATPDPGEGAQACGDPTPPALSTINVKVHQRGDNHWLLDSTPLVGPDVAYCAKIGFTDGRSMCPVRVEGNPQREACELVVTGRARDTGRPGPTWTRDGSLCSGPASGCENSVDNQYQVIAYGSGLYRACGKTDVCGEITVDR
jgi:hypothetical protein